MCGSLPPETKRRKTSGRLAVVGRTGMSLPTRCHLNDPKNNQTNPEIDSQSQVVLKLSVPDGRRKVGDDQRVEGVPRQHGDQRMDEVSHSRFRHRTDLWRAVEISYALAC